MNRTQGGGEAALAKPRYREIEISAKQNGFSASSFQVLTPRRSSTRLCMESSLFALVERRHPWQHLASQELQQRPAARRNMGHLLGNVGFLDCAGAGAAPDDGGRARGLFPPMSMTSTFMIRPLSLRTTARSIHTGRVATAGENADCRR
jgi:hypothetical protein